MAGSKSVIERTISPHIIECDIDIISTFFHGIYARYRFPTEDKPEADGRWQWF